MSADSTRFIKRCAEWIPKEESRSIPPGTRGIYALLNRRPKTNNYDVVYFGMTSRSNVGRRIARHKKSKPKGWSHFSIFEVKDRVSEAEVRELEGLLREIYRKDGAANRFNRIGKYEKLQRVRKDNLKDWNKFSS